jgi:cell wall-associated NlpC family hydrolase
MNKKNFLIISVATLSIVGVLNINVKTVSAAETSTASAATIAETPVPTAGVTKAVSEIDFSETVIEPALVAEPVVEPEPTYSINGYDGLSQTRYCIVNTAMGMVNQFTYNLGSKPDYNNNWKTDESLDCSGFVEYVFWLVTGQDIGEGTWMQSTENVEGGRAQYISHEELKPGDLAFLMDGRDTIYTDENGEKHTRTNHVGIYCGKDTEGNDLWCHCNAKDNTVAVNSVSYWTKYMRITSIDMESNASVLDNGD